MPQKFPALERPGFHQEQSKIFCVCPALRAGRETHHQISPRMLNMSLQPLLQPGRLPTRIRGPPRDRSVRSPLGVDLAEGSASFCAAAAFCSVTPSLDCSLYPTKARWLVLTYRGFRVDSGHKKNGHRLPVTKGGRVRLRLNPSQRPGRRQPRPSHQARSTSE